MMPSETCIRDVVVEHSHVTGIGQNIRVVIVDYGTGNVQSIGRVLDQIGVEWKCTSNEAELRRATHLILPGVGHCLTAMNEMRRNGTDSVLNELVERHVPVLGICLGMQLMTMRSAEGETECLGWFDAQTVRISPENRKRFKVPNIGWHAVDKNAESRVFAGIDVSSKPFYFCHSYAVLAHCTEGVSATLNYETRYAAALERGNIIGVQFHPEKSQGAGAGLIANFLKMERGNV